MRNLYWVGIKESEIRSCKELFAGSVTYNGSGKNGNISYTHQANRILNYNNDCNELDNFIKQTLLELIDTVQNVQFMFYTPSYAYYLGEEIVKHTIGLNDAYILNLLRDKLKTRLWLSNTIPVLKTIALPGNECSVAYFRQVFPGCRSFVLQGCTGSGGNDTYVIDQSSWGKIVPFLKKQEMYLLSPNLTESYSVNIHALIGENIKLTPGSVQIVENEDNRMVYHGADFIEYKNVPSTVKNKILSLSERIAEKAKNLGYRGILGIDYLVDDTEVFFLEINPRYQASTPLINLELAKMKLPSIQEIVLHIFAEDQYDIPALNVDIDYSNYIIDANENDAEYSAYLQNVQASDEVVDVFTDGYLHGITYENRASLFCIVLKTNICTINPNGSLNIHPNVRAYQKKLPFLTNLQGLLELKTSLLTQGVRFTPCAQDSLNVKGVRNGTYSSVDIYLSSSLIINCPVDIKLCSISPFEIDYKNNRLFLLYAKNKICEITMDFGMQYKKIVTQNNILYSDISFLATDRLRIHHSLGCTFKTVGKGCQFCDVPGSTHNLQMQDICEVLNWHLKNSMFRHILIGGGSAARNIESHKILEIIRYIRKHTQKDIYLMSLPPQNLEILSDYYESGLTEIAFNIEIFDRKAARTYMPGKGRISLEEYKNALLRAVELWGNSGNVKCLLVYGLESDTSFFDGVHWLASHGIQPVISVFRPLRNTEMENKIPSNSINLQTIYWETLKICQKYDLAPGPDCIFCQNNTLSLPIDKFFDVHN